MGDSLRLIQILNNLINNAVKFTLRGGVTINVHFAGTVAENKIKLIFEVIDKGIGIDKKAQSKIFDDFYQADSSITQQFGGTGLGLAITRQLISLQGGKISVESELGKGSKFSFDLSFGSCGKDAGTKKQDQTGTAAVKDLNNIRVLLVEDILVNQKVAVSYLKHWNAEVMCANNGLEGLKLFHNHEFDIILMDLYMPVLNGFDTIKRIRNSAIGKEIPIIALTASAETGTMKKAMDHGANACVGKPFNAGQLLETIRKLVYRSPSSIPLVIGDQKQRKEPSPKLKHISLKKIEEASLGNKDFIAEMIELLKKEIPEGIAECKALYDEKRYFDFSRSVHRLKNSLLMIGYSNLRKDLTLLQDIAEKGEDTEAISKIFAKVLRAWERGEKEFMSL